MNYDALVIGSGIGGMESALKLGDMGYKVLVVEKEASVGGKMILLSKVFPTLDCASCISTPKMGATIHHPNVTVLTYSEVERSSARNGGFKATIRQKPRFVDEALCTGCRQCEMACSVAVPDQFNAGMVSRRAAYIAFPQAVPKKAVIERAGHLPVHLHLSRRHQGPRLCGAGQARRVRESLRARRRKRRRWSAAWAAPATRPAKPTAAGQASKGPWPSAA